MSRRLLLLLLPAWLACGSAGPGASSSSSSSSSSGGSGEPAGMEGMVAAHNAVRHGATPVPDPPLPDLSWSADAARVAQGWADHLAAGCAQLAHNPGRGELGENIAWSSSTSVTAQDAVGMWAGEASCYDLSANTCACAQCGHYTQLVWRDTAAVGCGTAVCASGALAGRFWVCDYAPPGNYVGQRPY